MFTKEFKFEIFNDQIFIHKYRSDIKALLNDILLHQDEDYVTLDIYMPQIHLFYTLWVGVSWRDVLWAYDLT